MSDQLIRMEVDGREPAVEQLRHFATSAYGHFTAMQVRGGRVRGLDLHLARLDGANREMFGAGLDGDLIRAHIRHGLGDVADGSVRTAVLAAAGGASVVVTVRPPGGTAGRPLAVRSVPHQRPLPYLKQVGGGFGQVYYRRVAEREGFDEILLTGPDGVVSEGGITNVGFVDGSAVIWPSAPCLAGITMQLLAPRLGGAGLASRRDTVTLADVGRFETVFVTNSRGIEPVARVDDMRLPVDAALVTTLTEIYESVPWDRI